MATIVNFIRNLFKVETPYDRVRKMHEDYLADASDLIDLERRQRELDRMERNPNLKGWI